MELSLSVQTVPILMPFLSFLNVYMLQSGCSHVATIVDQAQLTFAPINFGSLNAYNVSVFVFKELFQPNSSHAMNVQLTQIRFHTICSLALYNIADLRERIVGNESIADLITLPGSPHYDYHIFFGTAAAEVQSSELSALAQFGRKLKNSYFIVLEQEESSLDIWRPSYDGRDLVYRSTYSRTQDPEALLAKVFSAIGNKRPNFMKKSLEIHTCAMCGQVPYEAFLATGVWLNEWDATMYELSVMLNATIQYNPVGALPKAQSDEDGVWDDWVGARVGSFKMPSLLCLACL